MDDLRNKMDLEARLAKLEDRIDHLTDGPVSDALVLHPAVAFSLGLIALVLGYLALGYPQHHYQVLFSGLLLVLLYHRGFLRMSKGPWQWPQIALNFLIICLIFKFLIGGGISHPFDWIKLPAIIKSPPPADPSWYASVVPDYTLQWQAIPKVSEWSLDITKIQTFLLLATFAGALFRFEPFTSITALSLLIISLPTYLKYNWDWLVLFLILGCVSIYLQSRANVSRR